MFTRKALTILAVAALAACGEDAKKIPTGTVSGRAVYSTGSDHSGISVTVGGFSAVTNASGNYSFPEVPEGAQVVIAAAPNSVERTQTAAVTVAGATAVPDLTFTQVIPLRGVASAVAGGAVTVQLDPPNGPSTNVDGSGAFSFANVAAGTHSLRFTSPTLSSVDTIPQVLYLPALGTFVVDTGQQNQLFQFPRFSLGAGQRLAQAKLGFATFFFGGTQPIYPVLMPDVSADGQLAISSELNQATSSTSNDNLYVSNIATGERLLVTDKLYRNGSSAAQFTPNSRTIAYSVLGPTSNVEVWAVTVTATAPLALSQPQKLADRADQWNVSPQNENANPVVLVRGLAPGSATVQLYAIRADNGQMRGQFNDVTNTYWLSVANRRVIFGRDTAGFQNLYSMSVATEQLPASPSVVEAFGGAYGWFGLGFSKGEGAFAYRVTTHPTATSIGLRVVKNDGTAVAAGWIPGVPAGTDMSSSTIVFSPDSSRVLFRTCTPAPCQLYRRPVDASAAAVSLGNNPQFDPWFGSRLNAAFSADGTKIVYDVDGAVAGTRELRLANADGSGAVTSLETSAYFNASIAADATSAVWHRSGVGVTQVWVRRGLLDATPPAAKNVDSGNSILGLVYPGSKGPAYRKCSASCDLYSLTAADVPQLVGTGFSDWNGLSQDGTRLLVTFGSSSFASSPSQTVKLINLATGSATTLFDRSGFGAPFQFKLVGSTEKLLLYRQNTPNPYSYQDGAYMTDLP